MEISDDARKLMENRVMRIMKNIDVPDNDKAEIKNELISNYTDASIVKAEARRAQSVEKADMAAVFELSEDPEDIASAYMVSYVSSLSRAGILSRTAGFAIDIILVTVLAWITSIPFVLPMYFSSPPPPGEIHPLIILPNFLFPTLSQYFNVFVISNLAVTFAYFVICEGFFGYTPGKWLMGLKVLCADGKKAGYRESMLRNISKLVAPAILVDAALMILYRPEDRRRMFDRIAGTIVIRR